jgi:hypothetical protein
MLACFGMAGVYVLPVPGGPGAGCTMEADFGGELTYYYGGGYRMVQEGLGPITTEGTKNDMGAFPL